MPPQITLCMIVRNEEANLPTCLSTVAGLVQEIVIVDTGSTDRTREIAVAAGARVVDFPWIDDFSAARNEALRHASGAWIFSLDADDRVDEENRRRCRDSFLRRCCRWAKCRECLRRASDAVRKSRLQAGASRRQRSLTRSVCSAITRKFAGSIGRMSRSWRRSSGLVASSKDRIW